MDFVETSCTELGHIMIGEKNRLLVKRNSINDGPEAIAVQKQYLNKDGKWKFGKGGLRLKEEVWAELCSFLAEQCM